MVTVQASRWSESESSLSARPHNSYLEHPIFLSGYPKSGTTLLLALLDNHPQLVVIPEELFFFEKRVLFAADKAYAVRHYTGFRLFLPDASTADFTQGKPWFVDGYPEIDGHRLDELIDQATRQHEDVRDLLLRLVAGFAEAAGIASAGRTGWVAKKPNIENYFWLMLRMFGQGCKFVNIVRDPRDVLMSVDRRDVIRGKVRQSSLQQDLHLADFAAMWQTRTRTALRYQAECPNFQILRYEDLVLNPEATLRRLCRSLNLEYAETLLRPTRHGKPWGGNSVFSESFDGISTEPVQRYKDGLTADEIAKVEMFLRKEMVALGYLEAQAAPSKRLAWSSAIRAKAEFALMRARFVAHYWLHQRYVLARYLWQSWSAPP